MSILLDQDMQLQERCAKCRDIRPMCLLNLTSDGWLCETCTPYKKIGKREMLKKAMKEIDRKFGQNKS